MILGRGRKNSHKRPFSCKSYFSRPDDAMFAQISPYFGYSVNITLLAVAATTLETNGTYNKAAIVYMDGAPETQSTNLC